MIVFFWVLWAASGAFTMMMWRQAWKGANGLPRERMWHNTIIWGALFTAVVFAALGVVVALLTGSTSGKSTPPPATLLPPAAELVITDNGCTLQPGDTVSVSVVHNTMIGFAYVTHARFRTYTARFANSPPIRPEYYLRFHSARPWGLWVSRKQFTRPVLHINCRGGRLGNITQPPWAQDPWPPNDFPLDD